MNLRHIEIGDILNGRTLYFTVQTQSEIDNACGQIGYERVPFFTDTNWCFAEGYNSYSLGTRYYAGLYQNYDGTAYLEDPVIHFLTVSWYNGAYESDVESGPVPSAKCPEGCGIVTEVNTEAFFYNYLYIDDDEIPFNSVIRFGNLEIPKLYFGETQILRVMYGDAECKPLSFYLDSVNFLKDKNQTWKDWIDQNKYTLWYTFTYDQDGVYRWGNAVLDSNWDEVLPNDLIVDGGNYMTGGLACLGASMFISTIDGIKKISELSVGDYLEEDNEVLDIITHKRNNYCHIFFENGDMIQATYDHIFLIDGQEKKTKDLQSGQKISDDLVIKKITKIVEEKEMYEIKTSKNTYELYNGIICRCENI